MTASFYDMSGGMVGGDKHTYWKAVKGAGWPGWVIGAPEKKWHLVFSKHDWSHNDKHTTTVTSQGNLMLKKDFSLKYIPHIPLTTELPSVLGGVWLAGVIVRSKSKPMMYMPSVHGQGAPLACCVYAMVGFNKNCGGYGVVVNPNTVVTSPSLSDFAEVLLGILYNKLLDKLVGKAIGAVFPKWKFPVPNEDGKHADMDNPVAEVLKWAFNEYVKKPHIDPKVEPQLQEWADGL